ncbi:SRPBCC family protein [Luteolibacter ambystomatis]|uniref:SRPBCC family protein n=1 Tax=Luteolibacter ambystomatis TaxID=2824561 RepID=A0A975G8E7_9BACT|nr:SRPBCC family protein [Luteolibacter ambystomatis]QUE51259.1 SRPBCC family protein [Luteolibacter ambystomatis]
MSAYGTIVEPGVVRFERLLPGPIERVWEFLTDSEKRGLWLASGPMELHAGGNLTWRFHHADLSSVPEETPEKYRDESGGCTHHMIAKVTRCEPPHVLAFTWPGDGTESEVTFELHERQEKVLLILTHRRLADRKEMQDVSGGWHSHLRVLADRLEGREPGPFWGPHMETEKAYERIYAES